jgi:hypothetical protein
LLAFDISCILAKPTRLGTVFDDFAADADQWMAIPTGTTTSQIDGP